MPDLLFWQHIIARGHSVELLECLAHVACTGESCLLRNLAHPQICAGQVIGDPFRAVAVQVVHGGASCVFLEQHVAVGLAHVSCLCYVIQGNLLRIACMYELEHVLEI